MTLRAPGSAMFIRTALPAAQVAAERSVNDRGHGKDGVMDIGRPLLRATVGAIFVEHGTQKLFGWSAGTVPTALGSSSSRSACGPAGAMRSRPEPPRQVAG